MEPLFLESRNPKIGQPVVLKLLKLVYFERTELNQTINIQHDPMHQIYDKVFHEVCMKYEVLHKV